MRACQTVTMYRASALFRSEVDRAGAGSELADAAAAFAGVRAQQRERVGVAAAHDGLVGRRAAAEKTAELDVAHRAALDRVPQPIRYTPRGPERKSGRPSEAITPTMVPPKIT
jgi:hypothetical protein